MEEDFIKTRVVEHFASKGFKVVTEVANLFRSADVAIIDNKKRVWVIECKVSNISRGIKQLKTHMHSADRVFLATMRKNTKKETIEKLRNARVGLMYVLPDGSVEIKYTFDCEPWAPTKAILIKRIIELT